MTLRCVHCGDYTLTPEEEAAMRRRLGSWVLGVICPRCNEEARITKDLPAAV